MQKYNIAEYTRYTNSFHHLLKKLTAYSVVSHLRVIITIAIRITVV